MFWFYLDKNRIVLKFTILLYFETKTDVTETDICPSASEADFLETNLDGIFDDLESNKDTKEEEEIAIYSESIKGKPCLLLNGFKYRKMYTSKRGTRWNCAKFKNCTAYLYSNNDDEIAVVYEKHCHEATEDTGSKEELNDASAVIITSRKGKEMLLFRQYTYRRQYTGANRSRWVCSTSKNCKAYVFTSDENFIISLFDQHCHGPPKYYGKPDNVLKALREPVILETD